MSGWLKFLDPKIQIPRSLGNVANVEVFDIV